jgi:uncharacterized protein YjbI with pentapeptide repeats
MRNASELLDDLINLNADEWNTKLAAELNMNIIDFKNSFLIRDKLTNISEDRIKLEVYKIQIKDFGDIQQGRDESNIQKIETGAVDENETGDDILYSPTTLSKFTVRENDGKKIVESISCTGKIIVGMDFSNAELDMSYFCHCIFYNCSFNEASLAETTFQSCIFNSCPFGKTDLTDSVISRTVFIDCNMDNACLNCAILTDSPIIACQINFGTFVQAIFINSGFIDCDAIQADFTDTKFSSVSMVKVNFKDSIFKRARLIDILMTRCDLVGCDLTQVMVTALTASSCKYEDKYIELFKMNHFLFSPSVNEWEDKGDK